MRFDLEIPIPNTDICFISNGNDIPNIASPLYYINIDTINKIPADYVTSDMKYSPNEFSYNGYEIKTGPYLDNLKSSRFLLTNIAKYSAKRNTKIPLFYRHFIPAIIKEESINIVDYYGVKLNPEEYYIDYDNNGTYVYMNRIEKILFVEYVSGITSNHDILNLLPVFEEADWSDLSSNGILESNKYIYRDGSVDTSYNGDLYITYISNTKLFRKPLGNIDDSWFVGILNAEIKENNTTYKIPEYYLQQLNSDSRYKYIEYKKCIKIFDRYVKSQYNIFDKFYNEIYLYIEDSITGKIKYAFSYNKAKVGTLYKDNIIYSELKYYNNDGIIESPVAILDTDIIYASHYTKEDYYEYNLLDLSSIELDNSNYYAIYIKPNVDEGRSVYHAVIGDITDNNEVGMYFNTFEDYNTYITNPSRNYYHVAIVGAMFNKNDLNLLDVRDKEKVILNSKDISEISIDMLYSDIMEKYINIPTNDAVLASIDISRLQDNKIVNITNGIIDDAGIDYLDVLKGYISRTLHASTKPIYEIVGKDS